MAESKFACEGLDWTSRFPEESDQSDSSSVAGTDYTVGTRNGGVPGIVFEPDRKLLNRMSLHTKLLTILKQLMCVPVESSCTTPLWMTHPYLSYYNSSKPEYKDACSTYNRLTQYLSFDDLYQLHSNPLANPVYFQREGFNYFTPDVSLSLCEELLFHQYKEESEVRLFLVRLYNITEKLIKKKNSMFIKGPANSGKSWFFEMVTTYHLNVGHVKNFVRGQNFPLNDCVNRRILMWNEPSIMPSAYDSVKMLTGGDPCAAAVKYEGDGKITRTPVIFTSNHDCFNRNPEWSSRIYFENWTTANFLSTHELYPHPLTYYFLIKKWVIDYIEPMFN